MKPIHAAITLTLCLASAEMALAQQPTSSSAEADYIAHCAKCHGPDRKGRVGVPNLSDKVWNWDGSASSIEEIIRHGIRTKDPKTHTGVMAGFKHNDAELSDQNISDLIAYIKKLAGTKADTAAVERAKENWVWCVDCHGDKGQGKQEIGAPNLVDRDWLYGGDNKSIATSIGEGRQGICPGGAGKLDEKATHALAAWLVTNAK